MLSWTERESKEKIKSEDRDKMVGHFRGAREAQPEVYDSPAQDVSVSGYSGRRVREEERAPVTPSASAPVEMEYLVKSGDCLSTIAQDKLGSVRHLSRLLEVNGLTESSTLRIGQRLILPHIGEREPVRGASLKPVRAVPAECRAPPSLAPSIHACISFTRPFAATLSSD